MEDLLAFLARGLVDDPDEVVVDSFEEDDGTIVLELSVAEGDAGKVIGRGGRTVAALRTVVKASSVRENRRVLVDVVDPAVAAGWRRAASGVPHGLDGSFHVREATHPLAEGTVVTVGGMERRVERRAGTDSGTRGAAWRGSATARRPPR